MLLHKSHVGLLVEMLALCSAGKGFDSLVPNLLPRRTRLKEWAGLAAGSGLSGSAHKTAVGSSFGAVARECRATALFVLLRPPTREL